MIPAPLSDVPSTITIFTAPKPFTDPHIDLIQRNAIRSWRDLGPLGPQFARGEFAPLKSWLGEKIHRQGQCYSATELVQQITGEPLSHGPLMKHLREKLTPLYGLK